MRRVQVTVLERVLVCAAASHGRLADAAEASFRAHGVEVERIADVCDAASTRAIGPLDLVVAVGDIRHAAAVAVERSVPVLAVPLDVSAGDVEEAVGRVEGAVVHEQVMLVVKLDEHPSRLALADCVITSQIPGGTVTVAVAGRAEPVRVPALCIANADPFGLMAEQRCRHSGPTAMLGVCWATDQPVADLMLDADERVIVEASVAGARLEARLDEDRISGIAERVRIGPNSRLEVVESSWLTA